MIRNLIPFLTGSGPPSRVLQTKIKPNSFKLKDGGKSSQRHTGTPWPLELMKVDEEANVQQNSVWKICMKFSRSVFYMLGFNVNMVSIQKTDMSCLHFNHSLNTKTYQDNKTKISIRTPSMNIVVKQVSSGSLFWWKNITKKTKFTWNHSHIIHGTGISTHIWRIFMVCEYTIHVLFGILKPIPERTAIRW